MLSSFYLPGCFLGGRTRRPPPPCLTSAAPSSLSAPPPLGRAPPLQQLDCALSCARGACWARPCLPTPCLRRRRCRAMLRELGRNAHTRPCQSPHSEAFSLFAGSPAAVCVLGTTLVLPRLCRLLFLAAFASAPGRCLSSPLYLSPSVCFFLVTDTVDRPSLPTHNAHTAETLPTQPPAPAGRLPIIAERPSSHLLNMPVATPPRVQSMSPGRLGEAAAQQGRQHAWRRRQGAAERVDPRAPAPPARPGRGQRRPRGRGCPSRLFAAPIAFPCAFPSAPVAFTPQFLYCGKQQRIRFVGRPAWPYIQLGTARGWLMATKQAALAGSQPGRQARGRRGRGYNKGQRAAPQRRRVQQRPVCGGRAVEGAGSKSRLAHPCLADWSRMANESRFSRRYWKEASHTVQQLPRFDHTHVAHSVQSPARKTGAARS